MFDPSLTQSDFRTVSNTFAWSSAVQQQIAGANPYRTILYLSATGANSWQLFIDGDNQRSPSLWPQSGTFQKQFTWILDGNLPSLGWWAQPSTPFASPKLSVLEVWFQPLGYDQ